VNEALTADSDLILQCYQSVEVVSKEQEWV
jgi:hypothetical protein